MCSGALNVIGSRNRTVLDEERNPMVLRIRRLFCKVCQCVHHELPDILVPYKRYASRVVEGVISEPSNQQVAAETSTLSAWRNWFRKRWPHWLGVFARLVEEQVAQPLSTGLQSAHERLGQWVGRTTGWLARIVQSIVNLHFWNIPVPPFLSGP
jgi:hypothetical protein